jgi:hypothetical protein
MTTAVTIAPTPILQFFNNQGQPCVGGTVLTQVGGVNYATYQDAAGTTPLPNPIPLNNRGEVSNSSGISCQLFLASGVTYTFTLFDAAGNQLNQASFVSNGGDSITLRADLASMAPPGAGMIGYEGTTTGEVGTNLSTMLNLTVKGLKKHFGAVGDGVANDVAAINNAYQASGKVIEIEEGTFLCSTAPVAPVCSMIVGQGLNASKLKAGAGVLKMLSLVGGTAPSVLRDFQIVGNATASACGIIYGDGALTEGIRAERIVVSGFTGTGAIGEYIRDMVGLTLDQCGVSGNYINRQIQGQTIQPTTLTIRSGYSNLATKQGLKVISVSGCTISDEHYIQTNGEEGILIAPAGDNVLAFKLFGCWFESNWYSLLATPATRLTKFHIDSTQSASGSTIQLISEYTKFDNLTKSVNIGPGNAGVSLFKPECPNLAAAITFVGGYGTFDLPDNLDSTSVVSATTPAIAVNLSRVGTQQPVFAAAFTPDFGLGSFTIEVGTLTAAIAVANPVAGSFPAKGVRVCMIFRQDTTGGWAVTWGTNYVFPVAWSNAGNTANKKSTIEFISDGLKLIAVGQNVWY